MKEKKADFILVIATSLFALFGILVFNYTDMTDMLENSVLLFQAIKEGEFGCFYTYSLENSSAVFAANYELPLYLIFLLWNLPTAIMAGRGGDYLNADIAICWSKGLIFVTLLLCLFVIGKISDSFEEKNDDMPFSAQYVWLLSSPLVFMSEFIAGQYDCIPVLFMLTGLYCYLKEKKGLFLFFFYLAFPLKSFSFFLFIPLLIFQEKKLFKILPEFAGMFLIPLLLKWIFRRDPAYTFLLATQNESAVRLIVDSDIGIGNLRISPFIAGFVLICIYCFLAKYERQKVIIICTWILSVFVMFVEIRSYWVFLIEPFILLLILQKPGSVRVNCFLHMVMSVGGFFYYITSHSKVYGEGVNTDTLLLERFKTGTPLKYDGINALL